MPTKTTPLLGKPPFALEKNFSSTGYVRPKNSKKCRFLPRKCSTWNTGKKTPQAISSSLTLSGICLNLPSGSVNRIKSVGVYMRQIRTFVIVLVSCVLALASANYVSAQSTTSDGIAKVVKISGDARYFTAGDSTPHNLKEGMILKSGTTIQTASGEHNFVDLVLNNAQAAAPPSPPLHHRPRPTQGRAGRDLRIFENSVLSVDKLTINATGAEAITDTELDLKAGSVLGYGQENSLRRPNTKSRSRTASPASAALFTTSMPAASSAC